MLCVHVSVLHASKSPLLTAVISDCEGNKMFEFVTLPLSLTKSVKLVQILSPRSTKKEIIRITTMKVCRDLF